MDAVAHRTKTGILRRFLSALGPGVTAGAADDDPSGIATYSIVGAQLGTSLLWTALITWPLMACVQFMCARIEVISDTHEIPSTDSEQALRMRSG